MTNDQCCGVNLSQNVNSSSNGLGVMMFWRLGGKGWLNQSMSAEGVCITALATLGLVNIYL